MDFTLRPSVSLRALKELRNIHSAAELRKRLEQESGPRTTLSFYRYVHLARPHALRDALYEEWSGLGVLGRTYLAREGVNAQVSLPSASLAAFRSALDARSGFEDMPFKIAVEQNDLSFLKLKIKVRPKLVADGLPDDAFDTANVGRHLSAAEFNAALERGALVVDMRNDYECAIGHFKGAMVPESTTFRDVMPEMQRKLSGKEKEEVLLYCTGGIRCEKASSWLRHHGFTNVGQLHGGIIDYARQVQEQGLENKYRGSNFVFDHRLAERISDEVVGECHQCGKASDRITNCRNTMCNVLLVQCGSCRETFSNCCTPDCQHTAALPMEAQRELRKGRSGLPITNKFIKDAAALRRTIAAQLRDGASIHTTLPTAIT